MTAVYLVRHPETTWNRTERYQGRLDAPWSAEGESQALRVAGVFADASIDAVVSSPLARARRLAHLICDASGSSLRVDDRFTEIALGPWEGLHRQEIQASFPSLFERWYVSPETVTFPDGGESVRNVMSRSRSGLERIFREHPEGNVVVVTHGGVIRAVVTDVLEAPMQHYHRIPASNAGISVLCGDAAPGRLLTLNSLQALDSSPVEAAASQDCVSWRRRRVSL